MGRRRIGWPLTLVAVLSLSGCVLAPSADDRPETPGARTAKVDAAKSPLLDVPGRPTPKHDARRREARLVAHDVVAAVKAFAAARDDLGMAVYVNRKRFKPDLDNPDSVEVRKERAIVTYIPAITPGMHTEYRFVVSRNSNEEWVVRGVKNCTVGFRTQCAEMSLR